jgi:TPR repeat protein
MFFGTTIRLNQLFVPLVLLCQISAVSAADISASEDLNQQLSLANELMGQERYQQAYLEMLKYAEHNQLAQFNLGIMELYGWGRDINQPAACEWFEKSAAEDIPMAQELLGDCYRDGLHQPANFELAKKWYLKAVENGLPTSNCKLGQVYIAGEIVEKNQRKGIRLCEQAGAGNAIQAQLYLAKNFDRGGEFELDLERALYWYNVAVSANNPEALYRIAIILQADANNPDKALEYSEAAARKGYRDAYFLTARLYINRPLDPATQLPTPTNLAKAYMWTKASLRQSSSEENKIESQKMLERIQTVMPETWEKDLDSEVNDHFDQLNIATQGLK